MAALNRENPMKNALLILFSLASCALSGLASAAPAAPAPSAAAPARQDADAVRAVAEQYLHSQSAGLTGKVSIIMGNVNQGMNLAQCAAMEAFQQPGARPFGKTTVGVRCSAPTPWTVYIQAQVSVQAEYVAAAMPLVQGQAIEAAQLVMVKGDLGTLPNGVLTDMAQAIGRTSSMSIAAGAPLRADILKSRPVVQQGQSVRVVSRGAGFKVSTEARAIGTAADGQVVQARTQGGAIVSGVARPGGVIEVAI